MDAVAADRADIGGVAGADGLRRARADPTAAFELALACDVLLAAERASFGLVEIVVGLTSSMGGPQRLAERAGPARARELATTVRDGVRAADDAVPAVSGALFATADLRESVVAFVREGPGKAIFQGR